MEIGGCPEVITCYTTHPCLILDSLILDFRFQVARMLWRPDALTHHITINHKTISSHKTVNNLFINRIQIPIFAHGNKK